MRQHDHHAINERNNEWKGTSDKVDCKSSAQFRESVRQRTSSNRCPATDACTEYTVLNRRRRYAGLQSPPYIGREMEEVETQEDGNGGGEGTTKRPSVVDEVADESSSQFGEGVCEGATRRQDPTADALAEDTELNGWCRQTRLQGLPDLGQRVVEVNTNECGSVGIQNREKSVVELDSQKRESRKQRVEDENIIRVGQVGQCLHGEHVVNSSQGKDQEKLAEGG